MENTDGIKHDEKCFGQYKCRKCGRHWMSGNAYVNYGQECQSCKINVKPFKVNAHEHGENKSDLRKPHPASLCERCKKVGPCKNSY